MVYKAGLRAKKAGISVNKKGKVKIPKKCARGTYTLKVRAAGTANYKAKSLKVKIKIF